MSDEYYADPVIVCVVGASGSGKTTLARFIERALGVSPLVSYTTRPMRLGEVDGVDHHFVSVNDMPPWKLMLAYTMFGGHHYWVPKADIYDAGGICTYVIDEYGLRDLKERYGREFAVKSILIKRDRELLEAQVGAERVRRDLGRMDIPEEEYDVVIVNNGTLEDFLAEGLRVYLSFFAEDL